MTTPEINRAQDRKRRIIFNNDGCDCFRNDGGRSPASLLDSRTTALADSQVDTIFYCTVKWGTGWFSHNTNIGDLYLTREGSRENNLTGDLIEQGTDALKVMVDWSRRHGREIFWSLRMNDTHDGWKEAGDFTKVANIKQSHADWLLGGAGRVPRYGRWTAWNYELPAVRDMIFNLLHEVAHGYDIDGVELDFLRHETYFPATAAGQVVGDSQRAMMTDLVRRVRKMLDEVSASRGKPLHLAIRVPDSTELCFDLGLDVESWLEKKMVDLATVTCYYQLNPWATCVAMAKKYGVPLYACLSEGRINLGGGKREPLRHTVESYRARILAAWQAGVDGIYFFNLFDPTSPLFREVVDKTLLSQRNRIAFASVRGLGGAHWRIPNHHRYRNTSTLSPEDVTHGSIPLRFEVTDVPIDCAGDLSHARELQLRLTFADLNHAQGVAVRFNGQWLPQGNMVGESLRFELRASDIQPEGNTIGVVLHQPGDSRPVWRDAQIWTACEGSMQDMENNLHPIRVG